MKIAGWQKLSLIDYPEKIATVIFLAGCNMRCHYCHNRHILDAQKNQLELKLVLDFLIKRKHFIEAVVVSGGEPTLYPDLIPLLEQLKQIGLLVKLDTNGTQPLLVQRIIELGLVDYVALDVKATRKKYKLITGVPFCNVFQTINYLKQQKQVKYMFRTTVSPLLNEQDLVEIGKNIVNGAQVWQIQQCRCDGAYSNQKINEMAQLVKKYVQHLVVKI